MRAEQRARRDAFLDKIGKRPVVMGILNLTPDSFSDGGKFLAPDAALAHAKKMAADGCDIIDVGGESTRPGASPVPEAEELLRVESVLGELAGAVDVPLSIDTYKSTVAAAAIESGVVLVNDIWGLQKDPAMADTVAAAEAALVIVHNRSEKDDSIDVCSDMRQVFDRALAIAVRAGIPEARIALDPGIEFGKTSRQNREALLGVAGLVENYALPILIGVSRKRFLGTLSDGSEATLFGTIAANLAAAMRGAAIFRVHDVAEHVIALNVLHTIRHGAMPNDA